MHNIIIFLFIYFLFFFFYRNNQVLNDIRVKLYPRHSNFKERDDIKRERRQKILIINKYRRVVHLFTVHLFNGRPIRFPYASFIDKLYSHWNLHSFNKLVCKESKERRNFFGGAFTFLISIELAYLQKQTFSRW